VKPQLSSILIRFTWVTDNFIIFHIFIVANGQTWKTCLLYVLIDHCWVCLKIVYPGYPQNPGVLNHLLYKVVIAKLVYCILQPQYELIIIHGGYMEQKPPSTTATWPCHASGLKWKAPKIWSTKKKPVMKGMVPKVTQKRASLEVASRSVGTPHRKGVCESVRGQGWRVSKQCFLKYEVKPNNLSTESSLWNGKSWKIQPG
jgi:hypothetical protein